MARLPIPGGDTGNWGDILNEFLSVEHNADGTLKESGSLADKADDNEVVKLSGNQTIGGTKTFSSSPIVPDPTTNSQAATKSYVDSTASSGAPDADATTKGLVQLAGDLSGTAASPQIAAGVIVNADISGSAAIAQSKIANLTSDLTDKQDADSDLTAIASLAPTDDDILQRKAGAWTNRTPAQVKTDLNLTKSDVGLNNVNNTSDATKPVSDATQTALDGKANVSHTHNADDVTAGTLGIARIPTGTSGTTVALGNHTHSQNDVTGLVTALDDRVTEAEVDALVQQALEDHTPGIERGYAERFTTYTAGNSDISGLSVTVIGQGRPVDVEFHCSTAFHSVSGSLIRADLKRDGTIIGTSFDFTSNTSFGRHIYVMRRIALTDGVSYTFTVGVFQGTAGTMTWYADATRPMSLSVVSR